MPWNADARARERSARGLLLGLALGDAVGAAGGTVPGTGQLRGTTVTQLACFTVEGLVRASVRMAGKGICDPVAVMAHAYVRWALLQGVDAPAAVEQWRFRDGPELDGWLAGVTALGERRGSAPATVAALRGGWPGSRAHPATSSRGSHALTRTLPLGCGSAVGHVERLAGDVAALTHAGSAVEAASAGAAVVHAVATGTPLAAAAGQVAGAYVALPTLVDAVDAAVARPGDLETLRTLSPDRSATAVLAGGVYAALSFGAPDSAGALLTFASAAPDSSGVAATAGALHGAASGPGAFPVSWLSRLELVWVVDTLARDMVRQMAECPSGSEYTDATDPDWTRRYPGS